MPRPSTTPRTAPLVAILLAALAGLAGALSPLAAPAAARAATLRTVVYRGARLTVPAAWPVVDLARDPRACVRFDRHAVYLGSPSAAERCPAGATGRTEAILAAPAGSRAAGAMLAPARGGSSRGSDAGRMSAGGGRVVITATWNRSPRIIERALGLHSLAGLARRAAVPSPAAREAADAVMHTARARTADAALPGGVYTGPAFDACSTPSTSQMNAWGASSYRGIGVYIGGENMACPQPNLTASWVSAESAAGWHLIPIFVGLQAPTNSCGCAPISATSAASEGTSDGQQAVADASAIGLGSGNPVYLDMEQYNRTTTNSRAVLAYIGAWTQALHAAGYRSGVYGNDNAVVADLAGQIGTAYVEPDDIWIANWNGSQDTSDSSIPTTDWADHQRLHQYEGAHNETYGGTTINIDGDYADASTAAAGSGTGVTASPAAAPGLQLSAAPTGPLELTPSWTGVGGISAWQLVGAQRPGTTTWTSPPVSSARIPLVTPNVYAYYSVEALTSTGQVLGSSAPVATPAHLALYGQSVFIPVSGPMGIPVGCFASSGCALSTTVSFGRQTIAVTGAERMGYGGGLVFASLSPAGERLLARARGHRVPVQIKVRDASGMSVTRTLELTRFSTTGSVPRHALTSSPAMRLIGGSDFVSNGWVGGLLVRCSGTQPCAATTAITAGGQTIAHGSLQSLGRGQIGYLMFTLTAAGHRLLRAAPGNQLPVGVAVTDGTAVARGTVSLIGY